MNAMARRIARLEKAEGEIKIDVGAELIERLAQMRAAKRRGQWVEPTHEESIARLRSRLLEPMSADARELTERLLRSFESKRRDDQENRH
jgi:hypothetical protein